MLQETEKTRTKYIFVLFGFFSLFTYWGQLFRGLCFYHAMGWPKAHFITSWRAHIAVLREELPAKPWECSRITNFHHERAAAELDQDDALRDV